VQCSRAIQIAPNRARSDWSPVHLDGMGCLNDSRHMRRDTSPNRLRSPHAKCSCIRSGFWGLGRGLIRLLVYVSLWRMGVCIVCSSLDTKYQILELDAIAQMLSYSHLSSCSYSCMARTKYEINYT